MSHVRGASLDLLRLEAPGRPSWARGPAPPGAAQAQDAKPAVEDGNVEALHKTILDECWRPAFARYIQPRLTGLRRELDDYLRFYNHDRVHHDRLTAGQIPADLVYGARKMEIR